MSRTINSIRNIKYAVIGQVFALFISFFARMFFVKILGSEYLGLNGLFTNIISVLSVVELGIGPAIIFSLYKPLAENDIPKIKALMNLYQRAYITIGIIIFILGSLLTPLLPFIIKDIPDIPHIQLIYLMFVTNAAISYFFSYKRSLIIADQKRYIATAYRYGFFAILNIVQIIVLIITKNFIFYLGVQIFFTLLENILVSKRADRLYPYLRTPNKEKLDDDTKKIISRNVKAMLSHKIGGIIVNGTGNLLISKFVGVIAVGLYSNYYLIISALNLVFNLLFQSITASVGNLGVTQTRQRTYFIFNSLNLAGFWGIGFTAICLFNLFNPFINLWLGEEYLFQLEIVFLIVLNFYLNGMRRNVLTFKEALGLYWYDRYKPFFEVVINFIVSIVLVQEIGIIGIFIGSAISTLTTCFWVEPYILFKYGFKISSLSYFKRYTYYTFILLISGLTTWFICYNINGGSLIAFLIKLLICIIVPNVFFSIAFWKTPEFKYLINILQSVLNRKGQSFNN